MGVILFLFVFFVFSLISTVLKASILDKRGYLTIFLLFLFFFSAAIYPISIHQNNSTWIKIFQNPDIVSTVAVLQILEAFLLIILSIKLIKGHYKQQYRFYILAFSMIPSVIFLGGIYLSQIFVFVTISGIDFHWVALSFAIVVTLLIFLLVKAVIYLLPEWEFRAELKLMISFVQILLAMFLPIILNEIKVPFTNLYLDMDAILISAATIIFFLFLGFLKHRFQHQFSLHKLFVTND